MNKYERQSLARAMNLGGDCLEIPDTNYMLEKVGMEFDDMDALLDMLRLIQLLMEYQQFDLEATRRERDQLQHMIDESGGTKNE